MNQNNSPIDIARQTLLQLSKRNQLPTPENYLSVYNEIAGIKTIDSTRGLGSTLQKVLLDAGKQQPKFIAIERSVTSFVEKQDWIKLEEQLRKLFPSGGEGGTEVNWSVLIRTLLKQLEMGHKGITLSRKREGLSRVLTNFASDPTILGEKIQALIRSWGNEATYTLDAKDSPPEVMANAAVSQLQQTSVVSYPSTESNTKQH